MARKYQIKLKRGASYTTPFGRKVVAGKELILTANDPHLEWFKGSSRFHVAAVDDLPARTPLRARTPRSERRKTTRNAIAPEMAQPASPAPVKEAAKPSKVDEPKAEQPSAPKDPKPSVQLDGLTRASLMSKAKEVGLEVKSTDTKAELKKRIKAHLGQDGDNTNHASSSE